MKKVTKADNFYRKERGSDGYDEIFNPDENLYNDPFTHDPLTFKPKVRNNVKNQISQNNEKK